MVFFPNCKINIGLDVLARRDDGFHELSTLMYPLKGFCDSLEIVPSDDCDARITLSGIAVDCDIDSNICMKAYRLMQSEFGIGGVCMHLHKAIPFGAGLGGGSADAAFAIKGFNAIFKLGLSAERMEALAARLGSDTAFFIKNRPALATSRGEVLADSNIDLSGLYIVLIKPSFGVSTAQAYAGIVPRRPSVSLAERLGSDIAQWRDCIGNDFEKHIFELHPHLGEIKENLYKNGALYASMSGSGSAVYGIFAARPDCQHLSAHEVIYQGVIS